MYTTDSLTARIKELEAEVKSSKKENEDYDRKVDELIREIEYTARFGA